MLRLYLGGAATRCRLNYAIEQSMKRQAKFVDYGRPAGGWGSVQSLGRSLTRERVPISGSRVLLHQNKPDGFACVSSSWAKPANPLPFEFCEEGAKATTWEITGRRCGLDFFEAHTVSELEAWTDHALEEQGRLTLTPGYCSGYPVDKKLFSFMVTSSRADCVRKDIRHACHPSCGVSSGYAGRSNIWIP